MSTVDVCSSAEGYTDVMEVRDPQALEEIYAFRARVWQEVGGLAANAFPAGGWRDAYDHGGRHWIVRDGRGRLVAAARLTFHATLEEVPEAEEYLRYGLRLPGPIAAPARVVVCPAAQGAGLGRRLLEAQDQAAWEAGTQRAVRQASPAMVRLLLPRGWRILGPATVDPRFPGVPFQVAVLDRAVARRAVG
jgi:GNAT superfamily N-acetyltransferase